jgi:hypothetical protein
MEVVNLGSLAVVTQTVDARQINRELRSLDPNLFLDFETVTPFGLVPVIKEHIGSAIAPLEVFRWQNPDGSPKPLCSAMVDEFKRQAATRGPDTARRAAQANRERKQRMHAEAQADMDEIHKEHKGRVRAAELDSLPPGWRPRYFGKR